MPVKIWTAVFLKELFIGRGLEASLVKGNRKISLMQTAPQFKHFRAAQRYKINPGFQLKQNLHNKRNK